MARLELKQLTIVRRKGVLPPLPYQKMKEAILGKRYELSIIFCSPEESKKLNETYRDKDYATNVLSFPLDKEEGEIYLSLSTARKDATKFDMSYQKFLHLLMIHGMLHLKGHDHGSTMEGLEHSYLSKFFRG